MRGGHHSFPGIVLRCAFVALLFAQVVPAQLVCSCDAAGAMDCCRVGELQQVETDSCCAASGNEMALRAKSCERSADSSAAIRHAGLLPSVEQAKPQLGQVAFVAAEPIASLRSAVREPAILAHAPPGSEARAVYLFCSSLLI